MMRALPSSLPSILACVATLSCALPAAAQDDGDGTPVVADQEEEPNVEPAPDATAPKTPERPAGQLPPKPGSPIPSPDAPRPAPPPPMVIDDAALDALSQTQGDKLTRDVVAEAMAPHPGGLTLQQVEARAADSSYQVAAAQAELKASAARVDQAFAAYFPKVTFNAGYSRLSRVVNSLDFGDIPIPEGAATFPIILNQWTFSGTLDVPISDYIFRLTKGYAAAKNDVTAREIEIKARRLEARANAKIAYFNWVRAQGQGVVSAIGTALSDRLLKDTQVALDAGVATEADVERFQAQLAQSKHLQNVAQAAAMVAGKALRTQMHIEDDEQLAIGVDVLSDPPPESLPSLKKLEKLAIGSRLELKALDRTTESLEEVVGVTRANHYPRLNAFATGLYANPNPRIFPQTNRFDFTWELGVRLTWTVNDTFATFGAADESEAQVDAIKAQRGQLEDAIRLEVTQSYYDLKTARSAIESAKQRERSARTNLAIRRLQFQAGDATATDLVDAEAQLIQAILQRIDAHVDYLVAEARLEFAVGGKL